MILPIVVTALILPACCAWGWAIRWDSVRVSKSSAKSISRMTAPLEWNTGTVNRRNDRCFAIFRE